jgi:hypothetical protein
MKKLFFVSILLMTAIYSNAQESGKIMIVKVFEFYGVGALKPYINIISPDNTIESIELDKTRRGDSAEQIANDKKLRDALDKVVSKGFVLKTSSQATFGPDNSFVSSTYVFEKK